MTPASVSSAMRSASRVMANSSSAPGGAISSRRRIASASYATRHSARRQCVDRPLDLLAGRLAELAPLRLRVDRLDREIRRRLLAREDVAQRMRGIDGDDHEAMTAIAPRELQRDRRRARGLADATLAGEEEKGSARVQRAGACAFNQSGRQGCWRTGRQDACAPLTEAFFRIERQTCSRRHHDA